MRILRYQQPNQEPTYGWFYENQVGPVDGSIFSEFRRQEASIPFNDISLLPPVTPSKIICVGRNYAEHAREHGAKVPEVPLLFLKPPSALLSPGGTVILPPQSQQVEHEAELTVVIGRKGRWIAPDEALSYVFGYTIGNDVTARDLQNRDNQWTRSKGFDTFCPIGPWIETDFDPADALITCHVNGEMRQMSSTREMIFRVPQLIAFASSIMTLEPGDLIMTGTPAGVGPLNDGDLVEVTIEGIGKLTNRVSARSIH